MSDASYVALFALVAMVVLYGLEDRWSLAPLGFSVAAAIAAVLLSTLIIMHFRRPDLPVYATEAGEQRSVRLPDGSTVELNSRSRVQVRFNYPHQRTVELIEGQALFQVVLLAQLHADF